MNEVEEIKTRLDIVEVIGRYLQLQKAGRSFKAPCPFHNERTPSFIVAPDRQSWHCFGACGTGGDVISFVMRKEGLEFLDALRMLAEQTGVKLRERRVSEDEDRRRQQLLEVNEAAAGWYQHLLSDTNGGRGARDYLDRRGIDSETAVAFLLGYSPSEWEGLRSHLSGRGFSDSDMTSAGLLVEGESGLHDRFRGRLMFPIREGRGRVIGFGARLLEDGERSQTPSGPKYINTSQTAVFDKGDVLYGLDRAQAPIRREGRAVIVEGYMDAIAAHQHGFENVVASMGTALTERQVRALKRLTKKIVLALDADAAGNEAAVRGHNVVREALGDESVTPVISWRGLVSYQQSADVELCVSVLPQGHDPDDVIRTDAENWRRLIDGAIPVLDYRLEASVASHDLAKPFERSQFVEGFLPLLTVVGDPVVRAYYLQRLSRLTGIREQDLNAMLSRNKAAQRPPTSPAGATAETHGRNDPREEFLLALVLQYPQLREDAAEMPKELLVASENRQLLAALRTLPPMGGQELEAVKEAVPLELWPQVERLISRRLPVFDEKTARQALGDCRRRLERRQLEAEKLATSVLLAAREEELGPAALVEAASEAVDDERIKEVVALNIRDMEMGFKLHAKERNSETEIIESRNDG